MVAPNKVTRTDTKLRSRRRYKFPGSLLILLFPFCIFAFWHFNVNLYSGIVVTVQQTSISTSPILFQDNTLIHEGLFTSTLKECLPRKKKGCKTFVPEHSIPRIALLAPPGKLTDYFSSLVQTILSEAKTSDGFSLDWIPTSHMAPYGYGKTHGWTKIIRIVPVPLLLGVVDTLHESNVDGTAITIHDIKANLRQQIRYHCRLNHISAHTALWTLSLKDISERPIERLIEQMQQFLDLDKETHQTQTNATREQLFSDRKNFLQQLAKDSASFLNTAITASSTNQNDLLRALDQVLLDEMEISKNLTAWPCQSFWTVGEPSTRLELSPIVSRIAKDISPDCTSPFVSCFVKRDKCEAKGDGKCS